MERKWLDYIFMPKNSKQKGKVGEREWRDQLRNAGFLKSYRGQQYEGSSDSPDVVCPELPTLHFEVKRIEQGNLYKWLNQAIGDAKDKTPVVAHRRNNHEWVCILRADDFLDLVRKSDLVQTVEHIVVDPIFKICSPNP
jgi:hypothetical protein